MSWPAILKPPLSGKVTPNLCDYAQTCADFSWGQARAELDGLPSNWGLNIAHEAVDRHANVPRAKHIAWRWLGKTGEVRDFTFADVRDATNRFANVLSNLGVAQGDRVFVLAGRIPELYIAALGTLKNRSVFCPLFSAFGPEPIRSQMLIGKPDAAAFQIVKAFVVIRPGVAAADALRRGLLGFARTRLGAVVAPKEIEFVMSLPKTRSGKIMRRLLKARELGLPEGDTSRLEVSLN